MKNQDIMPDNTVTPLLTIKKTILIGFLIIGIFVGALLIWSALVNIESAVLAQGKIEVISNKKKIQYLEHGIVREIQVREGSLVTKGQPLLLIEPVQAQTQLSLFQNKIKEGLASKGRLIAEKNNQETIQFPQILVNSKDANDVRMIESEKEILEIRNKSYTSKVEILQYRILQLRQQIESLELQIVSMKGQDKFIKEEIKAMESLANKQYIDKPRLWALYREEERLNGISGEYYGKIAVAKQQISEIELSIINLKEERLKSILEELKKIELELADSLEREKLATDVLDRTVIKSPVDGKVVNLQIHTLGGVVMPGAVLMEIMPTNEELIVSAKVSPADIEDVQPNQATKIYFTALNQRYIFSLEGKVADVSADVIEDKQMKESYYLVRINFPQSAQSLRKANIDANQLYPGMPVQVSIITNRQTPLHYLFSPILKSFTKTFKEK